MARASGWTTTGTASAAAIESTGMSSCVGAVPPGRKRGAGGGRREAGARLGVDAGGPGERGGDRIDGDVVVRRADPAGGEQIVVGGAQRIDRYGDRLLVVGHNAHFGKADALPIEPGGDLRDIAVGGPSRENLVADYHQRGGP